MTISFEYHGGTLTNNADSALRLMHDIARANASLYWQPNQYKDLDFNIPRSSRCSSSCRTSTCSLGTRGAAR